MRSRDDEKRKGESSTRPRRDDSFSALGRASRVLRGRGRRNGDRSFCEDIPIGSLPDKLAATEARDGRGNYRKLVRFSVSHLNPAHLLRASSSSGGARGVLARHNDGRCRIRASLTQLHVRASVTTRLDLILSEERSRALSLARGGTRRVYRR